MRKTKGVALVHADLLCVRDTSDLCRRLTALQTRVLRALTTRGENGVYSAPTLAMAQVYNSASMKRAIEKLVKDGLIYNFEGDFRFTNPFFKEWLTRR